MACGRCPALLPTSCFQTEPELASSHRASSVAADAKWLWLKRVFIIFVFLSLDTKFRSIPTPWNSCSASACQPPCECGFTGLKIFFCFSFASPYPAEVRALDSVYCSRALQAWQRLAEKELIQIIQLEAAFPAVESYCTAGFTVLHLFVASVTSVTARAPSPQLPSNVSQILWEKATQTQANTHIYTLTQAC